ncbi:MULTISPECIES: hypothetical protein [Aminobacter]|jgi:hypothetical protein|uniref:Uncharacterized protein n=2 Tax=Aminobacter TaxID=31988 RepID=A0AAC8YSI1_AMIAI|nr:MULTISPECIES: hypothetical protein [Aminobacter]AMS43672.1 hypothetical protein AA2016_4762 [Aminobacter aminovorans]MBA8909961.1 hypothetical protein [Aminobacter ciceronei]MBA9023733.1 hypothetical protein [Aminobacter ciceronei]MBB3705186.1 hypothetical protein [Aminobacter aminovorans]QNH33657.1 hypothetical protein H5P29_24685 [Aminobacter sp. MDW-2]
MSDLPNKPLGSHPLVQRLVTETSITEEEARELIALIGYGWQSLLREANLLAKKR